MTIIVLLISLLGYLPAKSAQLGYETVAQEDSARAPVKCSQPAAEQDPLISEAVEHQYTIRRVEFLGNTYTRDNVLRQRIPMLQEGELFTREKLVRGLKSMSRLKRIIHPVKLHDVIISLDREEKLLDMLVCFREKRR